MTGQRFFVEDVCSRGTGSNSRAAGVGAPEVVGHPIHHQGPVILHAHAVTVGGRRGADRGQVGRMQVDDRQLYPEEKLPWRLQHRLFEE